jgi:tRNA (mo5U34)-methyltransferase
MARSIQYRRSRGGRRDIPAAASPRTNRRTQASKARLREIAALGPWFHNLHLPDGVQTAPEHFLGGDFPAFKWRDIESAIPAKLKGWRVLDVGCNAGFYSFELAKRGASVLGIDVNPLYLTQARWAAQEFGLSDKVEFRQMEVYEIARLRERFDLVWFMGVFYHLRYPLLALDLLAARTRRLLMFQTLTMPGDAVYPVRSDYRIHERAPFLDRGWPKMAFVEHKFSGDPTNWWVANHAAIEAMLRSAGLRVKARPGHEMYLCQPDPRASARRKVYASQLRSLTRMIEGTDGVEPGESGPHS